jgi:hypothetical protein
LNGGMEFQFPKIRNHLQTSSKELGKLLIDKIYRSYWTLGLVRQNVFMLPVLQDIYENCNNQEGVNAIFYIL